MLEQDMKERSVHLMDSSSIRHESNLFKCDFSVDLFNDKLGTSCTRRLQIPVFKANKGSTIRASLFSFVAGTGELELER